MSSIRVAQYVALSLLAYGVGWLLFPLGGSLWGLLLDTVVGPESRWGAEGSRMIGQALQPFAYFLIAGASSAVLVFLTPRFAVRFSLLMAFGTLSYFVFLVWYWQVPLSVAQMWRLEAAFFIVVLPVLTAVLVRLGWLSRSRGIRETHAV